MGKSVSIGRRIQVYPKPVNGKLVTAESELNGVSKSSILDEALTQYYDRMSELDKRRLLDRLK